MQPSLEEAKRIARSGPYRRIPVKRELYADRITTIEAMRAVCTQSNHCFLLESAEPDERSGRYSFIGFNPDVEISCTDGRLRIVSEVEGPQPNVTERTVEHPGQAIRDILAAHRSPQLEGFPPFAGGLVGYFSYDYLKYAEPTLRRGEQECGRDFKDVDLMLFDKLIAFDSYRSKIVLIAGVTVPDNFDDGEQAQRRFAEAYAKAGDALDAMYELVCGPARKCFAPLHLSEELTPRFTQAQFESMVETAKQHIFEGDIFQVVLSNPLTARAQGSLFDTYRVLRCQNPSPYMFYFNSDDVEIAGASPETLGRLTNGKLQTYPLAGTRPRGATPEEDLRLEMELKADEKELAEHTMLVDLGRNDLGRISELGSVRVDSSLDVLRFSHVMHLGSTVSSRIAENKDAVDAIDSILPAGTLSGAPKLRACSIIQKLEGSKRGIYGGAIGYLDFAGNMDTCIGIRLAYKKNGEVCVQSGAGIVADSDPAREHHECLNKARAVIEALHEAEGGLA